MTDKLSNSAMTGAGAATPADRIALALILGAAIALGAPQASPASASELKMPSAKSRLLRDRDDVTVIIIDKDDHRRSRSTSPARLDPDEVPTPPSSRIRRDDDNVKVIIKRRTGSAGSGHKTRNPGPKVIIVDKNRGSDCGGGVCVIRP